MVGAKSDTFLKYKTTMAKLTITEYSTTTAWALILKQEGSLLEFLPLWFNFHSIELQAVGYYHNILH